MANINFNFFDSNGIGLPKMPPINIDDFLNPPTVGLPKTGLLGDILGEISDLLGKFDEGFSKLLQSFDKFGGGCGCPNNPAPIQPPNFADSCQPEGSLQKTGDNVITTPGGYKIEMVGQFEWKITGPDNKTTRVWGDPHVDEGDGGKWDFKRDSTFVLGDGTRINVSTTPWSGNQNMTVTQKLEIISGNDRIVVNDIDKGKGKIGEVTKDGYASVNNFAGKDVFVMGKETDDWSYQGREIIGSNNGGETFNLGGELAPPTRGLPRIDDWASQFLSFFRDVLMGGNNGFNNRFIDGIRQNPFGANPYAGNNNTSWESNSVYDRQSHLSNLQNSFAALGRMFESLSRLAQLSRTVDDIRMRQRIA